MKQKTDRIPLSDISNADATRLQNEHCYAKSAANVSNNHTVNEIAADRANCDGHTTLFPTSTTYMTTSSNAKHTMVSAQSSDLSQACSTRDITRSLISLQGTQNRLSQHCPDTHFKAQATSPVNQLVGALGSTQFCSTANSVGRCMVNLATSQSPLVLSSNNNVYASRGGSRISLRGVLLKERARKFKATPTSPKNPHRFACVFNGCFSYRKLC